MPQSFEYTIDASTNKYTCSSTNNATAKKRQKDAMRGADAKATKRARKLAADSLIDAAAGRGQSSMLRHVQTHRVGAQISKSHRSQAAGGPTSFIGFSSLEISSGLYFLVCLSPSHSFLPFIISSTYPSTLHSPSCTSRHPLATAPAGALDVDNLLEGGPPGSSAAKAHAPQRGSAPMSSRLFSKRPLAPIGGGFAPGRRPPAAGAAAAHALTATARVASSAHEGNGYNDNDQCGNQFEGYMDQEGDGLEGLDIAADRDSSAADPDADLPAPSSSGADVSPSKGVENGANISQQQQGAGEGGVACGNKQGGGGGGGQSKLSLTKSSRKLKVSAPAVAVGASGSNDGTSGASAFSFKPDLSEASAESIRALAGIEAGAGAQADSGFNGVAINSAAAPLSASKINPKMWLCHRAPDAPDAAKKLEQGSEEKEGQGEEGEGEEYVNMYWTDASESNGIIYLFGKLPLREDSTSTSAAGKNAHKGVKEARRFVSCCVAVHGAERNLFVLPRRADNESFNEDGSPKRLGMADVYKELTQLLVPSVVPRQQGQSFRCKGVQRSYAFEHSQIPRGKTEYMKVVYSARHPAPPATHCEQGGKTFERIFGAGSSPLELFLLKRKLMGPCWITIRKPRLNPGNVSWCRVELTVENPKLISKAAQSEEDCGVAPAMVALSLSMKTAVNPASHLHEIVMLSGVIHTKLECEGSSDSPEANPKVLKRFTIIRQLGLSCGSAFPAAFPHDLQRAAKDASISAVPNERALLSLFFSRLQQEDPDIIASHNLLGFEADVLLARAVANKLPNWSLLGRLRKSKPPRSCNERDVTAGRILCDTYKAAKEFLRETTYSLTHLAKTQLKANRVEVDPVDVPRFFSSSADIIKLAMANAYDAMLVQGLMLKLQVVPLTKQLTNISGNLWSRTIKGARAERIEYLLLHEFHKLKYILPEKKAFDNNGGAGAGASKGSRAAGGVGARAHQLEDGEEDLDDGEGAQRVGGMSRKRAKAAYAGGLVLEPKKGLYDTYILLLDFNSLYPSIIQEYNLCFTTIDWSRYTDDAAASSAGAGAGAGVHDKKARKKGKQASSSSSSSSGGGGGSGSGGADDDSDDDHSDGDEDGPAAAAGGKELPPLPDSSIKDFGVLPRVIKTLVDRRRTVKDLLKKERDVGKKQELDIRQKALKLTANSMYGCLGFSFSRFYARPIAALVTAMGREALQRTVDLATNQMGLDVIYGDTDSVMINTNSTDLAAVKEMGNLVKKEVNKLYRSLELDLDGIFKSMLLLKKKKYAALVINELPDGTVGFEREMKGLDLVRRDWCNISKAAGGYVVEQILSGKPREEIVLAIHNYLTDLSAKIRAGEVKLEGFVITKGLNKNPKDYPDCKGQAHLQVALKMLKANRPVNIGDHIPYVICSKVGYRARRRGREDGGGWGRGGGG